MLVSRISDLASFCNDSFADRGPGVFSDTDSGEHEHAVTAEEVAGIIEWHAVRGFEENGPFAEVPGIPYTTPFSLVFGGLVGCDPAGGSSSSMTFLESIFSA